MFEKPVDFLSGKNITNTQIEKEIIKTLVNLEWSKTEIFARIQDPEVFSDVRFKEIYKNYYNAFVNKKDFNLLELKDKLNFQSKEDFLDLFNTGMIFAKSCLPQLAHYCLLLVELHKKRLIYKELTTINSKILDNTIDFFELIDNIGSLAKNTYDSIEYLKTNETNETIGLKYIQELEMKKSGKYTALRTGIIDIDRATDGFLGSELVVIAGRPSMGKSALAQTIIYNNSIQNNIPCCFMSLEMNHQQLLDRFVAMELGIPVNLLRSGKINEEQLENVKNSMQIILNENFHPLLAAHISPPELILKINKQKQEFNIKYMVVDYLQLLSGTKTKFSNRDIEIGEITRTLKNIALDLDITIILLSQLNRSVEATPLKIPAMAHLRESGNIEQDADFVMLLWRPEEYSIGTYKFDGTTEISTDGICQILIPKGRNTGNGKALTYFDKKYTKFTDLYLNNNQPPQFNNPNEPDFMQD